MPLFKLKRISDRVAAPAWIEVLAVEPYAVLLSTHPHEHAQDILCQYVCRVPTGPGEPAELVKLDSKVLWSEIGAIYVLDDA